MLRPFRWSIDASWNGRHFLPQLLAESGLLSRVSTEADVRFADHFAELSRRWSNAHRYTSEGKLLKHLNAIGATTNVKGDKLKENSRIMTEAANFIVGTGNTKWDSR